MEAILAREIKAFRKQFRSEHGRDPSKRDIERQPDIAASYATWLAIKSNSASSQSRGASSSTSSSSKRPKTKAEASGSRDDVVRRRTRRDDDDMDAKRKSSGADAAHSSAEMAPPPTTPQRTKVKAPLFSFDKSPVRTPKQNQSAPLDVEMASAVYDSAGSVRSLIDVPTTPQQQQRQQRRRHGRSVSADETDDDDGGLATPSPSTLSSQRRQRSAATNGGRRTGAAFDDGTSPSKLRSLIASFGVPASKSNGRTAVKQDRFSSSKSGIDEEDERLQASLRRSKAAVAQNGNLFTPRTKARKRLRGELVVTPRKSVEDGNSGDGSSTHMNGSSSSTAHAANAATSITPTKLARPAKRQRGMGTLKDFGIVSIAGTQPKSTIQMQTHKSNEDDDDDDDDLMGPSPSARRVVVMPMPAFRPLFDDAAKASVIASRLNTGEVLVEVHDGEDVPPSSSQQSVPATMTTMREDDDADDTDTALTTPAVQEEPVDSDEEDRRLVRAYQRFEPASRRRVRGAAENGLDVDEDDGDDSAFLGGLASFVGLRQDDDDSDDEQIVAGGARRQGGYDDNNNDGEQESRLLRSLSLSSPQCKRARRQQRRIAAQSVRNLLYGDAGAADVDIRHDGDDDSQIEAATANGAAGLGGTSKRGAAASGNGGNGVTVHGHGKTARMMRGTLTKTARRNLAAAESADEQRALAEAAAAPTSSDHRQPSPLPGINNAKGRNAKSSTILRRGRDDDDDADEDEYDEEEDGDGYDFISHHRHHHGQRSSGAADDDDDEWASDVDSVDYGLGDGYMDDVDVL